MEPMRRLLWRDPFVVAHVSRRRFARELLRGDDDDRLFNHLPPVASFPSSLLPAICSEENREKEGEQRREGKEKKEEC